MFEYANIISLLEKIDNKLNDDNKVIQALLQTNQVLSQALAAEKVLMIQSNQTAEAKEKPSYLKGLFKRIFG
jgi:hypothetical protein